MLRVGPDRNEMAIRSWGSGAPAVILDAGSSPSSLETSGGVPSELIDPLARRTTVCTYDRPGTGSTASLPDRRRRIARTVDAVG